VQLTPLLERLLRRFPGLHVKTTQAHGTPDMLQLLRDDGVDICFGLAAKPGKGVVFTPYQTLEIVLLSPKGTNLPPVLKFSDLARTPLISRTPSKERAALLDNYCVEGGFRPNFVMESDDSSVFVNSVKAGIGSCMAWSSVGEGDPDLETRRFSPPHKVVMGFYHSKKPSAQIRTLLSLARQIRPSGAEEDGETQAQPAKVGARRGPRRVA
jgi:DNA-binding transcriptional LysR family regulator